MHAAERRARLTGAVLGPGAKVDAGDAEGAEFAPPEGKPRRAAKHCFTDVGRI